MFSSVLKGLRVRSEENEKKTFLPRELNKSVHRGVKESVGFPSRG